MNIQTACLPITEHMQPLGGGATRRMDLTVDQVVMMLLSVHCHADWRKALLQHFPKRKLWVPIEDNEM